MIMVKPRWFAWAVMVLMALVLMALWMAFVVFVPITVSISFDDGIKSHIELAAPLIERYGWRATFNVPTAFMDPKNLPVSELKAKDMHVVGHESDFMTWRDVRELVKRGHEVNPHTVDHTDLRLLDENGQIEDLKWQIKTSIADYERETGRRTRFYCAPHNRFSKRAISLLKQESILPFACSRLNMTDGTVKFIEKRRWLGIKHFDLMVHGIEPGTGGYLPFEDICAFARTLEDLHGLERRGIIRVVPYESVHLSMTAFRYLPQKAIKLLKGIAK